MSSPTGVITKPAREAESAKPAEVLREYGPKETKAEVLFLYGTHASENYEGIKKLAEGKKPNFFVIETYADKENFEKMLRKEISIETFFERHPHTPLPTVKTLLEVCIYLHEKGVNVIPINPHLDPNYQPETWKKRSKIAAEHWDSTNKLTELLNSGNIDKYIKEGVKYAEREGKIAKEKGDMRIDVITQKTLNGDFPGVTWIDAGGLHFGLHTTLESRLPERTGITVRHLIVGKDVIEKIVGRELGINDYDTPLVKLARMRAEGKKVSKEEARLLIAKDFLFWHIDARITPTSADFPMSEGLVRTNLILNKISTIDECKEIWGKIKNVHDQEDFKEVIKKFET
jgi:hypothetical protein